MPKSTVAPTKNPSVLLTIREALEIFRNASSESKEAAKKGVLEALRVSPFSTPCLENNDVKLINGVPTLSDISEDENLEYRNSFDTYQYVKMIFEATDQMSGFFYRNCTFLSPHLRNHASARIVYSISQCLANRQKVSGELWYLSEVILPGISADKYLIESRADAMILKYILSVFTSRMSKYCFADPQKVYNEARSMFTLPEAMPVTLGDLEKQEYKVSTNEIDNLIAYLVDEMNQYEVQRTNFNSILRNLQIGTYISLSKASISTKFRNAFNRRMSDEYPDFEMMDYDDMKIIKKLCSTSFSNPEKAREMLDRWTRYFNLSELSMTVKLILERAIFQGITSYRVIREMFISYGDFPWYLAQRGFPKDITNFTDALSLIGDGAYQGYDDRPDAVWHRNRFRNLGWIAITLAMNIDPENYALLENYAGTAPNIKNLGKLALSHDAKIDNPTTYFIEPTISVDDD